MYNGLLKIYDVQEHGNDSKNYEIRFLMKSRIEKDILTDYGHPWIQNLILFSFQNVNDSNSQNCRLVLFAFYGRQIDLTEGRKETGGV